MSPLCRVQGEALLAEVDGFRHAECSALTQDGLEGVRCALLIEKPTSGKGMPHFVNMGWY